MNIASGNGQLTMSEVGRRAVLYGLYLDGFG